MRNVRMLYYFSLILIFSNRVRSVIYQTSDWFASSRLTGDSFNSRGVFFYFSLGIPVAAVGMKKRTEQKKGAISPRWGWNEKDILETVERPRGTKFCWKADILMRYFHPPGEGHLRLRSTPEHPSVPISSPKHSKTLFLQSSRLLSDI